MVSFLFEIDGLPIHSGIPDQREIHGLGEALEEVVAIY